MSTAQSTNLFNKALFPPFLNFKFPYINILPLMSIENKDNKSPLLNSNIQLNPIPQKYNFPIFYNNNIINFDNRDKNSQSKGSPNQAIKDTNLNLLNNINNSLLNPSSTNFFITNNNPYNHFNNLPKSHNTMNNDCILSDFTQNWNINFYNNFLNSKDVPTFHKIINKENIIHDDIIEENSLSANNKDDSKTTSSKQVMFKLQKEHLKKKRGRASIEKIKKDKQKRQHTSLDFDNILRKLQVHYLTYIIQFVNIILDHFYPSDKNFRFLNISYNEKKNVKHSYVESLKIKKIKDILILPPSSKYKINSNENINLEIYERISNSNSFLKDFFEMKYLELFNKFYMKNEKIFTFNGITINFEKVSFFSDLINANPLAASKMKQIAQTQFYEKGSTVFVVNKI